MNILVTGGTGFIGSALLEHNGIQAMNITATYYMQPRPAQDHINWKKINLADSKHITPELLKNIDVVIHLAGLAHGAGESDEKLVLKINVEGTRKLLASSISAGVKQFIYLSTAKVHGETNRNYGNVPFTENINPDPVGIYATSKSETEILIKEICHGTSTRYTIIRPPLIFGPGVRANFLSLLELVASSLPLPFGKLKEPRSMIYIKNLCDILIKCINNEKTFDQTLLVKDIDVSTSGMVLALSESLGSKTVLINFPVTLLKLLCTVAGKRDVFDKLEQPLVIDNSKCCTLLSWQPEYSMQDSINATTQWYLNNRKSI